MKILAFGASNSLNSINKQFANFAAHSLNNSNVDLIDLNDFDCSIYSPHRQQNGFPDEIILFMKKLEEADLVIISLAEYNGSYPVAFKNIFDWCSTYKSKTFENKNFLLLGTSTGARGASVVLDAAIDRFPRHGANILGHFSLPNFHTNFNSENGIIHPELNEKFNSLMISVENSLKKIKSSISE